MSKREVLVDAVVWSAVAVVAFTALGVAHAVAWAYRKSTRAGSGR